MDIETTTESQKKRTDSRSQRGAGMVEYALLVALIAVVAVVSTRRLGVRVSDKFGEASLQLEGAGDWED